MFIQLFQYLINQIMKYILLHLIVSLIGNILLLITFDDEQLRDKALPLDDSLQE